MRLEIPRKAAQPLLEDRNINPPDKLVPVINIENKNSCSRTAFLLGTVGHAQIEVSFRLGLTRGKRAKEQKKGTE